MIIEKNSEVTIVVPGSATERELFAANELKKYIKEICGAELKISTDRDAVSGYLISIGGPERNSVTKRHITEEEFDKTVPGPEGLFIKSYDDCLVLAGSSKNSNENERGTIYAVYEFLERFLDCSLAAYTKEGVPGGEYVSQMDEIDLSDIYYSKSKADLPMRGVCAQYSAHGVGEDYDPNVPFLDWLCKNR